MQPEQKRGFFGYFSTDAMGLTDFVESHTPSVLNPTRYLPSAISSYLPFGRSVQVEPVAETPAAIQAGKEQMSVAQSEDEQVYLMYSWWILHEGWRGIGKRVEQAVEDVFGG